MAALVFTGIAVSSAVIFLLPLIPGVGFGLTSLIGLGIAVLTPVVANLLVSFSVLLKDFISWCRADKDSRPSFSKILVFGLGKELLMTLLYISIGAIATVSTPVLVSTLVFFLPSIPALAVGLAIGCVVTIFAALIAPVFTTFSEHFLYSSENPGKTYTYSSHMRILRALLCFGCKKGKGKDDSNQALLSTELTESPYQKRAKNNREPNVSSSPTVFSEEPRGASIKL